MNRAPARLLQHIATKPTKALLTRTMATASVVQLDGHVEPEYYRETSADATKTASELLQINHEKHHIFFNTSGFHNHIAHQMFSMYALGATPDQLQREYKHNESYQLPLMAPHASVLKDLEDPKKFVEYLGPGKYYNDYLQFLKGEMENTSWQEVLQKYVFAGDERAERMLVQMFAGFLHPIIHLGFGIEFEQPAVIAEALAQAACHDSWIGDLLLPAEKAANSQKNSSSKSIAQLIDEIHSDKALVNSTTWEDGNKIRDGVLARAGDRMLHYASQVHVNPSELEEKTAEMTNAVIYYTGGAQRPDRAVKFDFYFMHCVNCSIFFPAFNRQTWLSEANKVRLLEWKIRMDLAMYASRKCPDVRLEDIRGYKPKMPSGWDGVEDRVLQIPDDGHAAKLIRAIAHGEKICKKFEGKEGFRLKGGDWLQLGHMVIDSCERKGESSYWVRSAGFDEAWEEVTLRANL